MKIFFNALAFVLMFMAMLACMLAYFDVLVP